MIRNNLSWINLNAGSSGSSGGGGVSDYNDLANRPIISMTGTSQNPLKLWNLSTGLYLLNGYVYYNTTNTRESVNLFVSITAQIQNGKYVLSAFVPSWEGHYEYIKANSTSTEYTDTQILKMLTEDEVLTLTNEVEYTPTTDYHPSTKKYVDEAMQSVMEEFAKMGVNEQDIKTLIAENRRRDIAIQALLNETADKNVTIEEDTHTISLDYSMEDGMATVNSIEGSTLVNVSKTVDEVYVTKSQDRVEQTKVANTIGEQNGKICPIIEGDTLVNVCDQKEPIAITKSYAVENSGNHIALQGEYDGSCRPVIQGNTMVNLATSKQLLDKQSGGTGAYITLGFIDLAYKLPSNTYTMIVTVTNNTLDAEAKFRFDSDTTSYYTTSSLVIPANTTGVFQGRFSWDDNIIKGVLYSDSSSSGSISISNIMIFEGDLTQTPELIPTEYVEGLKSSFEDNVVTQAMVDSGKESAENLGKYKVEYKATGKNKFDEKYFISHNCNFQTYLLKGDYTFTGTFYAEKGRVGLWFRDESGSDIIKPQVLVSNGKSTIKFTNPKSQLVKFVRHGWDSEVVFLSCENLQLEEGTTPTEYEPYKEYTKTFYLNSPLLEGDTIEDVNGVATHVKRWGKVVLDGSETWVKESIKVVDTIQFWTPGYSSRVHISDKFRQITNLELIDNIEGIRIDGDLSIGIAISKLSTTDVNSFKQWLQANPTTVVYELASPIYEPISTESILCDSYVNGHLDVDSAVPIEKVVFDYWYTTLKYLQPNTTYAIQFESDNKGEINIGFYGATTGIFNVEKGLNKITLTTPSSLENYYLSTIGIGFNASNIVVTEAIDKEFDYFNGIQSTFEENLVTDENNLHYGKYRVIYRTKSSDGNASTVKSVYLNSPLLQGDKLVVVNGKLCHYHKMGMVVLDGSEDESWGINSTKTISYHTHSSIPNNTKIICNILPTRFIGDIYNDGLAGIGSTNTNEHKFGIGTMGMTTANEIRQWLQVNPITVVYELASPYYEEISSNPKDTIVDFYANGTLEVQSAVYPLSMEFTSFEEELTYLYASTVYTVQFEANGNAIANITLGGTTVTNQEIIHGLNKIQVTTPSTLVDNKLIIDGCGDCKISKVVVTNSTEEFEYFEGMKSAFEDKQNEDGTYTVEIVVYNAPIRLNKDKE